MADEPRKRSRFDQTEPEPKRPSRFDQRSRSPSSRKPDTQRSRSPVPQSSSPSDPKDKAAAAAAAAAKINAQLQAKRGAQKVDIPPVRRTSTPGDNAKSPDGGPNADKEVYQQDGDYIKDIEVNDLRNRYTLTKGATQKMIKDQTGADVTTRGEYYPDKSMARPGYPPLYLHITSQNKDGLEKAIAMIEEMMKQDLPNLIDERRFRRREQPEQQVERDEYGRRKWPEEKIPIDLEPIPGFNLRAQVVGHGGAYVKHIQSETSCRVQIKGRGSGFTEKDTGIESDEPMYLHVAAPQPEMVQKGKELCEDLLKNVREQYHEFKARGPPQRSHGYGDRGDGGHGRNHDGHHRGGYGGGGPHQSSANHGYDAYSAAAGLQTLTPSQQEQINRYATWYAQYPDQDPYIAYGGYQAYVQYYYSYMHQAAQQPQPQMPPGSDAPFTGSPPPPPAEGQYGESSAPPPPPPTPGTQDQGPPPPPPPPGTSQPDYSSVPPPPGM